MSPYDPENLTTDDAKAIFSAFREAGIRPGPGMKETMEAAGFDAEQLRTLGRPEGGGRMPPPPMPGGMQGQQGINTAALDTLKSILNQYDLTNLSEEDQNSLQSMLSDSGLLTSSVIVDMRA